MSSEPDEVKYPFTDAAVLESDLRDWLARVLYPSEYQRGGAVKSNAKRRVVARITYARANHRLKRAIKHRVIAADFFEWACEQKGWSRLKQVQGLPLNATVAVNSSPIEASSGSVSSLFLPKDKGQLQEALSAQSEIIKKLKEALFATQKENEHLRQELQLKRYRASEGRRHGLKGRGIEKDR